MAPTAGATSHATLANATDKPSFMEGAGYRLGGSVIWLVGCVVLVGRRSGRSSRR